MTRLNGPRVGSGKGRRFERVRLQYSGWRDNCTTKHTIRWEGEAISHRKFDIAQSKAATWILRVVLNTLFNRLKSRARHYKRLAMHARNLYYTPLSPVSCAHSSILPSSSSSGSSAFFANLSASSLNSFGTSSCRPLVGPLTALTHVISSSKSLSLLSSCAT
jgi:hypothetical protein